MFSKRDRAIYRYWDGSKIKIVDPDAIRRRLAMMPDFDLETEFKCLQLSNTESLVAYERIAKATKEAFRIKEFEELDGVIVGLTDGELIELLADFAMWCQEQKKNGPELLAKSQSVASGFSPGASENQHTPACLASP